MPRRRTEFLARAGDRARPSRRGRGRTVLRIRRDQRGTLAAVDGPEVHAADIDPAAVALRATQSSRRAPRSTKAIFTSRCPIAYAAASTSSSPTRPYVPTRGARPASPRGPPARAAVALEGGGDGLEILRRVAAEAPSGSLRVVTSSSRRASGRRRHSRESIAGYGLVPQTAQRSELGATVVIGTRPARRAGAAA